MKAVVVLTLTCVEALALQNCQTVVLKLLQQLHFLSQVLQLSLWGCRAGAGLLCPGAPVPLGAEIHAPHCNRLMSQPCVRQVVGVDLKVSVL